MGNENELIILKHEQMFQTIYTGSQQFQSPQYDAAASLGGFISNTSIPNNMVNNIFSCESYLGIKDKQSNVRCIILKATQSHSNLLIGVYPDDTNDNFDIRLGFVVLGEDTQFTEQITSEDGTPFTVSFNDIVYMTSPSDTENMFEVTSSISEGRMIAIWIKRTLKDNYDGNPDLVAEIAEAKSSLEQDSIMSGFDLIMDFA
jgi:hypothetical protein